MDTKTRPLYIYCLQDTHLETRDTYRLKVKGWFGDAEFSQLLLVCKAFDFSLTSLVALMVKRLSTMWETSVRSLGQEEPLEKEMAIHSITIAWKIPWTEKPGGLQSMGWQSQTRLSNSTFTFIFE